jgi:hypothetical protein
MFDQLSAKILASLIKGFPTPTTTSKQNVDSQHAKAATAEGLTFSDPMHKKVREIQICTIFEYCNKSKSQLTCPTPAHLRSCCGHIIYQSVHWLVQKVTLHCIYFVLPS